MASPTKSIGASQTQEDVIATFPVPRGGVNRRASEVEIQPSDLWIGENLHLFQGEARQRPSWNLQTDSTLAVPLGATLGSPVGIFTCHRPDTRNQFLILGGTKQVHVLASTGYVSIASWGATRARTNQVRMTEIAIGTPLQSNVVICNGIDTPIRLKLPTTGDPSAANVASLNPPVAAPAGAWKDVCTASDRIVGITNTEVQWGESLQVDDPGPAFPATAVKSLAETLDLCVAVRPIGTLNVGVWKERSFWVGAARGGSTASYFSWRVMRWVDGPAAPNALCQDTIGNWYWITKLGRIVMMDPQNFTVTYPGDGVWPITRAEMPVAFSQYGVSFAFYRPFFDEVWFFYQGTAYGA